MQHPTRIAFILAGGAIISLMAVLLLTAYAGRFAFADNLWDTKAGFAKAKYPSRQSITVYDNGVVNGGIGPVLSYWNSYVGWPLFVASRNSDADVVFPKDALGSVVWVELQPAYNQAFAKCTVHGYVISQETARHEVGHCLGFADHVDQASYDWCQAAPNCDYSPGTRICDNPASPLYSPYQGIMSYCWLYQHGYVWGPDDPEMLRTAGYTDPVTLTPTSTATPVIRGDRTPTPSPTATGTPAPSQRRR